MTSSTRRWREVRPLASAGPSGISRTVAASGWSGVCLATTAPLGSSRGPYRAKDRCSNICSNVSRFCRGCVVQHSYRRSIERTFGQQVSEAVMASAAVQVGGQVGQVRLTRRGRLLVVLGVVALLVVGFSIGG